MGRVEVRFPHFACSGEPQPMPARAIWAIALGLRERIIGRGQIVRIPVERIVGRIQDVVANGIEVTAYWDLDHEVTNDNGAPAMGVCEYDPGCPGAVMVSINRSLTQEREDLLRSTILHELGHVLFDAPSWVRQGRQMNLGLEPGGGPRHRIFRSVTAGEAHLRSSRSPEGQMDWREFRANEFMGAFCAPPRLLAKRFLPIASNVGLVRAARPSAVCEGIPAYDLRDIPPEAVDHVVDELAEMFGLTSAFMLVRLMRYDLLRAQR